MAAAMSIEAVFAALPDGPLTEEGFDDALRRIFKIREGDFAKLEIYRTTAFSQRLVLQNVDGLIVKTAELPRWPTQEERDEAIRVQQRKEKFAATAEGGGWIDSPVPGSNMRVRTENPSTNPLRVETERFINEIVGARFEALEERLSDLQDQIASMQAHDEIAA